MERTLEMDEQKRQSRVAAGEANKKNPKKGGENTPPPNGNAVSTPIAGWSDRRRALRIADCRLGGRAHR